MEIKNIAVIGAGVMGADVAFDFACYGFKVILKDLNDEILKRAEAKMTAGFRMVKMLKPELEDITLEGILGNITFTADYAGFEKVDLVIENVSEDFDVKKAVYGELEGVCREDTVFAANTSCISITKIAALMKKPENVIGAHFMNPVPLKKMVETVRGYHTTDETVEALKGVLKKMGKNAIVVNDFPGFVANRLSHLFMNEAAFLVQDGVAAPKEIDQIFKQGYGHKMGPLETADLIGLDTVVMSLDVLYESYQDPKFRCAPLLRKMVDAGLLGKKSGEGFYKYR